MCDDADSEWTGWDDKRHETISSYSALSAAIGSTRVARRAGK